MTQVAALLRPLAVALVLTVVIELAGACLLFGLRTRRALAVVALAQVVTNPSVELVCLAVGWTPRLPLASLPWLAVAAAELAAFAVEALLYRVAEVGEHPWRMAAVLNAVSFGLGLVAALVR